MASNTTEAEPMASSSGQVRAQNVEMQVTCKTAYNLVLQEQQSIKMDDLPSLWQRNAANMPQQGLGTRRSLAPTSSTMGSPFTNPQGLGSLASTVLPGMWRRASQPLPSYLLDEVAQAPVASAPMPVISEPEAEPEREPGRSISEPRQRPANADKLVVPVKQKAGPRPRPNKRDLIPAISTHASGRMSSQLSSTMCDVQYGAKQVQPVADSYAWRTLRRLLLVSRFPQSCRTTVCQKHVRVMQLTMCCVGLDTLAMEHCYTHDSKHQGFM